MLFRNCSRTKLCIYISRPHKLLESVDLSKFKGRLKTKVIRNPDTTAFIRSAEDCKGFAACGYGDTDYRSGSTSNADNRYR